MRLEAGLGARLFAGFVLVGLLSACASYGEPNHKLSFAAPNAAVAETHEIFVASTRVRDGDGNPIGPWEAGRSDNERFFTYDVSIPNGAKPGRILWASGKAANPARDFAVVGSHEFGGARTFADAVSAHAGRTGPAGREALLFVHGFNTSFAQGLFRLSQIDRDFKVPGTKILYDWPSAGTELMYLHDQDSQLFARDGLAELLDGLAHSRLDGVVIMAYSSGAGLAMEALRQLELEKRTAILRKIRGIILISPDLDVDVFEAAAARLGKLPQPFFIFSSRNDFVLNLFAPLWGDKERLGHLSDLNRLGKYDITFIDPGAAGDNGDYNHLAVAGSPTFIAVANGLAGSSIVNFARLAEAGGIPGSQVNTFGQIVSVVLPARVAAAAN